MATRFYETAEGSQLGPRAASGGADPPAPEPAPVGDPVPAPVREGLTRGGAAPFGHGVNPDPDDPTRWAPPPAPPERLRWRSFEEMRDRIARVGDVIELDPDTGDWYRRVKEDVDRRVLPDGRVQMGYRTVRRAVALSAAEARAQAECDSHNGWTFVRDGRKCEREYPENLGTAGSVLVEWQDVAPPPEEAAPAGAAPRPRRARPGGG